MNHLSRISTKIFRQIPNIFVKGLFCCFFMLATTNLFAQEEEEEDTTIVPTQNTDQRQKMLESAEANLALGLVHSDAPLNEKGIRVMFYNVENLFLPENDSLTNDEDFTPTGMKAWTYYRYQQKLNNIYKVIMAAGGWEPPGAIGFCELECRQVLEDLINKTPLKKFGYKVVHEESPDRRVIDVGFIYRPSKFKYIEHEAIRLKMPFDPSVRTRDILHIRGQVLGRDTLSIFVNHWPSRWGGQMKSEPGRVYAASLIRKRIDEMYVQDPYLKAVVIGDMNDHATDKSLVETLKAKGNRDSLAKGELYNYTFELDKNWQLGSHKYQGHWGTLDHIIITEPLLNENRKNHLKSDQSGAHIFAARFLLEEDTRFLGLQPFRTYSGPRFIGGFSDHLPVYIDLLYE